MKKAQYSSVAAVVVTYNRKAMVQKCVLALLSQTRPMEKIIVVDNASTDGTSEMLHSDYPQVELISLPKNTGGSGGFARGISLAYEQGYDWIWAMDDDTIPKPEALSEMVRALSQFSSDEKIGVLQSVVQLPNGDEDQCINVINPSMFNILFRGIFKHPVINSYTIPIDFIAFVGCLINAKAVQAVGPPEEFLFIYTDDARFGLRMKRAGYGLYLLSKPLITHQIAATGKRSVPWRRYHIYRNGLAMLLDYQDIFGWGKTIVGIIYITTRAIGLMIIKTLTGNFSEARAIVKAVRDGLLRDFSSPILPG